MIANIRLQMPGCIDFGAGRRSSIIDYIGTSERICLVCDPFLRNRVADDIVPALSDKGAEVVIISDVIPELPVDYIGAVVDTASRHKPDTVIGIGGGSTIDCAKLLAVLVKSSQNTYDVINTGTVGERTVKLVTLPTTAGTGSEVTPIAVVTDDEKKVKKGIVSPCLIPDAAIIDAELTVSMPPHVTAATGVDALTHCIEAYTNRYAHPVVDGFAREGIRLIMNFIERAVNDGADMEARSSMSLGSLYGGLCLGPVNTAAVHALAYPVGGEFKVPHGVANSVLLPYVMQFNLSSCGDKYVSLARFLGTEHGGEELAQDFIHRVREISRRCGIPVTLKELGITESDIPWMANAAVGVTRLMNNNPRPVTEDDAERIYRNAYRGILDDIHGDGKK